MTNIPQVHQLVKRPKPGFSLAIITLLIYSFYFSKFESKWRFSVCFLLTLASPSPPPQSLLTAQVKRAPKFHLGSVNFTTSLLLCPRMALAHGCCLFGAQILLTTHQVQGHFQINTSKETRGGGCRTQVYTQIPKSKNICGYYLLAVILIRMRRKEETFWGDTGFLSVG